MRPGWQVEKGGNVEDVRKPSRAHGEAFVTMNSRSAADLRLAGNVDEFELDAVRIGEEDSVVTWHILWIFARGIEHYAAKRRKVVGERVYLLAIFRAKRYFAQPNAILTECV
jgi:hypothetical protein